MALGVRFARTFCAVTLLAALALTPSHAQTLESRLLSDAADGRLDDFDFISACLIASGVTDECELAGWHAHYLDLEHAALAGLTPEWRDGTPLALKQRLHRYILKGRYHESATDLRVPLGEGSYNCLSAAALYFSLAKAAGINLEPRLARGHINLAYRESGKPPLVLEPGSPESKYQPEKRGSDRSLTSVELLAKIYYNRGVGRLKDQQFAEGLRLLAISTRLDEHDPDAKANLVAGLNNWAAAHCATGDYAAASHLIAAGLQIDPNFPPLLSNQHFIQSRLTPRSRP